MTTSLAVRDPSPRSRRIPTSRIITLSPEERKQLESLVRRGTTEQRIAKRAKAVLLRADDVPVLEAARQLGVERNLVRRWCDRYAKHGLPGLSDRPRPGRPRTLSLRPSASC